MDPNYNVRGIHTGTYHLNYMFHHSAERYDPARQFEYFGFVTQPFPAENVIVGAKHNKNSIKFAQNNKQEIVFNTIYWTVHMQSEDNMLKTSEKRKTKLDKHHGQVHKIIIIQGKQHTHTHTPSAASHSQYALGTQRTRKTIYFLFGMM